MLASHPLSRDIHINSLSVTFHGVELLSDTRLELNSGRRYGLVGLNGSGMLSRVGRCPVTGQSPYLPQPTVGGSGLGIHWRQTDWLSSEF